MANLYGRSYKKNELLTRVGDIAQLGGVKLCELADGNERGVRAADFRTGAGFNFRVLMDRGLDISFAEYKGQALSWYSSTGEVAPAYFEPENTSWLRSFFGGLLTTCGLTYLGQPCVDEGKSLGLHGRVSNIPAKDVCLDAEWNGDEYFMWVQGKVRETAVFGENIMLKRRISAKLGEAKLWIDDVVENLGYQRTEHMILYHINAGFPLLDEGAQLISPTVEVKAYDEEAEKGKPAHANFSAPVPGCKEQCFYHSMKADKEGKVLAGLVNRRFNNGQGFGLYVKYALEELPNLTEWKMMGEGLYVVGIEPTNCLVEGRAKERQSGTLQFLEPGEKREYHLELGVLSSIEEINTFAAQVKSI